MPHLFAPYTLKGVTLRNRIAASPMCQYSQARERPNVPMLSPAHPYAKTDAIAHRRQGSSHSLQLI